MNEYQKVIYQMIREAAEAARKDQRPFVILGDPDNVKWCEWGPSSHYRGGSPVLKARLDTATDVWEVTAIHDEVTVTQVKRYGAWIGEFSSPDARPESPKFVPMPPGDLDTRKAKSPVEELADAMESTLAGRIGAILMRTGVPPLPQKPAVSPAILESLKKVMGEHQKQDAGKMFDPFGKAKQPHPTTLESLDFLRAERGEPTLTQADEIRALRAWVRHGSGWFDDPNKGGKK